MPADQRREAALPDIHAFLTIAFPRLRGFEHKAAYGERLMLGSKHNLKGMRSEQLATNGFKAGLVSYSDAVNAQQAVLFNERTATQIAVERMLAAIVLLKALCGDGLAPSAYKTI